MSEFPFHPELFEARGKAMQALAEAGFAWFVDYSAIDVRHENRGLEVTAIPDVDTARGIARVLRRTFPDWPWGRFYLVDWSVREPGWLVLIARDAEEPTRDPLDPSWRPRLARFDDLIARGPEVDENHETGLPASETAGKDDENDTDEPVVVVVPAPGTTASGRSFRDRVLRLVNLGYRNLVLDLHLLDLVDDSVPDLLRHAKRVATEAGGTCVLAGPTAAVAGALSVLGLEREFEAFPDPASARTAIGQTSEARPPLGLVAPEPPRGPLAPGAATVRILEEVGIPEDLVLEGRVAGIRIDQVDVRVDLSRSAARAAHSDPGVDVLRERVRPGTWVQLCFRPFPDRLRFLDATTRVSRVEWHDTTLVLRLRIVGLGAGERRALKQLISRASDASS